MPDVEITLPSAPPDDYLRWMAFWREVEQKMGESPALGDMASQESAPFLQGETAAFLATVVVGAIITQSTDAKNRGETQVAPVLIADPDRLARAIDVVTRRAQWMTPDRLRAMGIEPLDTKLAELRMASLTAVSEQIAKPR